MCTFSYCDGSCNARDEGTDAPDLCRRPAGGRECRTVLEADGSCAACETVTCSICGEVMPPGVATEMPDPETHRPLRLCGVCVVEVRADAAEVEAEARRLLNGRDPEEDEGEVTCETVIDACSLSGADLIADGTFGRKAVRS